MIPVLILAVVVLVAFGMLYLMRAQRSAGAGSDHGSSDPPTA
jgi:hypothetical protein